MYIKIMSFVTTITFVIKVADKQLCETFVRKVTNEDKPRFFLSLLLFLLKSESFVSLTFLLFHQEGSSSLELHETLLKVLPSLVLKCHCGQTSFTSNHLNPWTTVPNFFVIPLSKWLVTTPYAGVSGAHLHYSETLILFQISKNISAFSMKTTWIDRTYLHCVSKKHPGHFRLLRENQLLDFNNFWYKYFWHNLPSNDHSVSHLTQCMLVHYLVKPWTLKVLNCAPPKCGLEIAHFACNIRRCISRSFSDQSERFFHRTVGLTQLCVSPHRDPTLCLWFLAQCQKNANHIIVDPVVIFCVVMHGSTW